MQIRDGFIDTIGNTPLIKLRRASEETGCTILGKAEFLNPGGSVKDRAALFIVKDAEERGAVAARAASSSRARPAIPASAWRWSATRAAIARVIVMPETQSQEKKDMLRLCGADLRLVPAVPYANPMNYVRYSERLAKEIAAERAERRDLGQPVRQCRQPPRALRDHRPGNLGRRPTARSTRFVASVGTGGTLAGVAMALKERNPTSRSISPTRWARRIYSYYAHGELKAEGNSITEGIGQSRITKNLEGAPIDGWFQVTDEETLPVLFDLVLEEGLILGGSTGINIVGAIKAAKELGPGHTIVTILADYGTRYQSKLFNPAFLREKKLPVPGWLDRSKKSAMPYANPEIARLDRMARAAISTAGRVALVDGSFTLPGVTPTAPQHYAQARTSPARCSSISTRSRTTAIRCRTCCRAPAEFARMVGEARPRRRHARSSSTTRPASAGGARLVDAARLRPRRVAMLDGGLPKWLAEGRPVTSEVPHAARAALHRPFDRALVRDKAQLLANLSEPARAGARRARGRRFAGTGAGAAAGPARRAYPRQPQPALRSADRREDAARSCRPTICRALRAAGLAPDQADRGQLRLRRHRLRRSRSASISSAGPAAIYDGSWSEWGLPGDTPVATGPAPG